MSSYRTLVLIAAGVAASGTGRADDRVRPPAPVRQPAPPGLALSDWKAVREYALDGTNYARVDDHPDLRVSALTITAWVNTADLGRMQPILAKAQAKGNWCSYLLRIQDGGRVSLAVESVSGERSAHWKTKGTLTAQKWPTSRRRGPTRVANFLTR